MNKNRSNLTEVLIKKEYAEAMVNDFNHANLDLKNLNEADLKMAKLNIISIIGALDDLQKSINEELSTDTTEAKVKKILKGYTNSSEREYNENKKTQDTKEKGSTISNIKKSSCNIEMEVIEDKTEESNECTLEKVNDKKVDKEHIEVDESIFKAIKIARKYNFGIPFIEDGIIVDFIRNGNLDNKEALLHIQQIYREALKAFNIDSEDVSEMIRVINSFDNENIEKKSNKNSRCIKFEDIIIDVLKKINNNIDKELADDECLEGFDNIDSEDYESPDVQDCDFPDIEDFNFSAFDSDEENFLGEKISPKEYSEAKEILAEIIRERLIKKLISEIQNGKINPNSLPFAVNDRKVR